MTYIALMVEIALHFPRQTRIYNTTVTVFQFVVGTVVTIGQVLRPSNSNGDNAFAQLFSQKS